MSLVAWKHVAHSPFLQVGMIWIITFNGFSSTTPEGMGEQSSSIHNLTCLFYDKNRMNCSWNIYEASTPDTEYRLSYELFKEWFYAPCGTMEPGKVTCLVRDFDQNGYNEIRVCAMESQHHLPMTHCINVLPVLFYKASPPVNVMVKGSKVVWSPPTGEHLSCHFKYQIQITDVDTKGSMMEDLNMPKWDIDDQSKSFSVQVRARIDHFLPSPGDLMWSDWTDAVITEKQTDDVMMKSLIVTTIVIIVMVLLLIFLRLNCNLLEHLCQPIPDPKQKFSGLFENYNGEFQQWINANHLETEDPKECATVIVED